MCRGDWKGSQSWCWIRARNTCKLCFYGNARVLTRIKNSLEKLDNELHVKVKKCVIQKQAYVFFFPTNYRVSASKS